MTAPVPEGSKGFLGIDFSKLQFTKEEVSDDTVRAKLNQLGDIRGETADLRKKVDDKAIKGLDHLKAQIDHHFSRAKEKKLINSIIKDLTHIAFVPDRELQKAEGDKLSSYLLKIRSMLEVVENFQHKEGPKLTVDIKADLRKGLELLHKKEQQILERSELSKGSYTGLATQRKEEGGFFAKLVGKNKDELKALEQKIIEKEQNVKEATNLVRTFENKITKAKTKQEVEKLRQDIKAQLKVIDDNLGTAGMEPPKLEKLRKELSKQGFEMGTFKLFGKADRENLDKLLDKQIASFKEEQRDDLISFSKALKKVPALPKHGLTDKDSKLEKLIDSSITAAHAEFKRAGGEDMDLFKSKLKDKLNEQIEGSVREGNKAKFRAYVERKLGELA